MAVREDEGQGGWGPSYLLEKKTPTSTGQGRKPAPRGRGRRHAEERTDETWASARASLIQGHLLSKARPDGNIA